MTMKVFRGLPWMGLVLAAPTLATAQVTVTDNATNAQLNGNPRATISLGSIGGVRTGNQAAQVDPAYMPEFHTVQRGDTLWDITGYYFENPWRWPAVWGRNPQITNPHWIFPGDQVRLLEHSEVRAAAPTVPSQRISGRPGSITVQPRVPRGTVFLREEAWASIEDINASGTIYGAPEDNMMLAEGDQVYLRFDRRAPNVGEAYTIYQSGQATTGSDRDAGRVVRVLGTAVVDAWDRERHIATARITESIEPIERGERVAIVQRQFEPVTPLTNDRDLAGHVVATPQPRTIVGGQYVVIVDRGEQDGVHLGNRFFLTRRGDPWNDSTHGQGRVIRMTIDRDGDGQPDAPPTNPDPSASELPVEVIGELLVVATHPRTSVCLVTGVSNELEIGQPVVMRRGY
jgi:hypothetical protein